MNKEIIPRPQCLKRIEPYFGKDLIKVIVGQRRVGKSCLLRQVADLLRDGSPGVEPLYLDMELTRNAGIRNWEDLVRHVEGRRHAEEKLCVLIDEAQEIEGFERALRGLLAEGRYDLYCTGSNARMLSGELATLLSGRCVEIEVRPLSYGEFLQFHGLADNRASLLSYLRYGGMPFLRNLKLEDDLVFDYLKGVYNSILYKDVVERAGVRNAAFLERLAEYLADNIGSLVSAQRISQFLKSQRSNISPNVVLQYLGHLASAYFVRRTPRADIQGKKIFEVGEKYYFEDLGLRHTLLGFRPGDVGKLVENVVASHLGLWGWKVYTGVDGGGREVDFVCERGGGKLYVQCAYLIVDEATREREFGNLLAIKDNHPKVVVSMDELAGGGFKGVRHLGLSDFLLKGGELFS